MRDLSNPGNEPPHHSPAPSPAPAPDLAELLRQAAEQLDGGRSAAEPERPAHVQQSSPPTAPGLSVAQRPPKTAHDTVSPPTPVSVVDRVLSSAEFQRHHARLGRAALEERSLQTALSVLLEEGDVNVVRLSALLGSPQGNPAAVIASLRRNLNLDAYEIVRHDPATDRLVLDRGLLAEQYSLGTLV